MNPGAGAPTGTAISSPTCAPGTSSTATRGAAPAAGASIFSFPIPKCPATCRSSTRGLYKKAHRHGPGRVIVIPVGEGYSIMWEEGKDKVVVPWHEASCFVPPNKWFHQHFNAGGDPARYLALHPPMQFHGHAEKVEDRAKDQIEYVNEDKWVREKFEGELAKTRTDLTNAVRSVHGCELRMELVAVSEEREVTWVEVPGRYAIVCFWNIGAVFKPAPTASAPCRWHFFGMLLYYPNWNVLNEAKSVHYRYGGRAV